jgi:hypothetical protein
MINETCETKTVDISSFFSRSNSNYVRQPKLISCGKPATHYFGGSGNQAAVCDECLEILKNKDGNARVPIEKI